MNSPWSWRRFARGWNRFFFTPEDPLTCDIMRILYALLILVWCVTTWSHCIMWYGETGVLPWELSRKAIDSDTWTVFQLLPAADASAWLVWSMLVAQATLLLLGVWSRVQAVGVYVWMISLHHRNVLLLDAEDGVFRLFGFILMFMPLGHTLSVDAWWRRRQGASSEVVRVPCWALRLLQMEMCLIFFGCAFSKAASRFWLDGTAMYYATRLDDLFQHYPLPHQLWESMLVLRWMGYAVIALEALVPLLVWFRETRWPALIVAAIFHLGCEYSMNLYLFHWIMFAGWCSFVQADEWRGLAAKLGRTKIGRTQNTTALDLTTQPS